MSADLDESCVVGDTFINQLEAMQPLAKQIAHLGSKWTFE